MKATTVLSVLPIFSGSSLTAPVTGCTPYSIALLTIDSGTDLMYGVVEAQETRFWVGRKTKSYCPLTPADYPAGNESYMSVLDGSSSLSMAVEVPGGQQVFISPKGALRYTDAHSGYVPPGSITSGFSVSHPGGDYVDILSHEGGFFRLPGGNRVRLSNLRWCGGLQEDRLQFRRDACCERNRSRCVAV